MRLLGCADFGQVTCGHGVYTAIWDLPFIFSLIEYREKRDSQVIGKKKRPFPLCFQGVTRLLGCYSAANKPSNENLSACFSHTKFTRLRRPNPRSRVIRPPWPVLATTGCPLGIFAEQRIGLSLARDLRRPPPPPPRSVATGAPPNKIKGLAAPRPVTPMGHGKHCQCYQ